jgi:hypothetical protein
MTLAFEFAHKTCDVTDQEISLLTKAMHRHSVSARNPATKVYLPTLTDACLQTVFDIGPSPGSQADIGTYARYGILPAAFFEGSTRRVQLLNRAIACVAKENNEDLFRIKKDDDDDDDNVFRVECIQCGNPLAQRKCGLLLTKMREHVTICTHRRDCSKCSLDFSLLGMFGTDRSNHERTCLSKNDFQQQYLDWLHSTMNIVTNQKIGQFGFPKKGYANKGPEYSKAVCKKKYHYIHNKLIGASSPVINQPYYHQLLAAVNNVRGHHGMEPLANRFATSG